MHGKLGFVPAAALLLLGCCLELSGQQLSKDEQQLLLDGHVAELDKGKGSYPISISTWVKHCWIKWGGKNDPPKELELLQALALLPEAEEQKQKHYRLTAVDAKFRSGDKDADWHTYGVVRPADDPNTFWLQYFVFFGWNEPEAASSVPDKIGAFLGGGDADPGRHEGDWLSYAVKVNIADRKSPKPVDVFVFNHGRPIFADDPFAPGHVAHTDDKSGVHVKLCAEDGTNELWPFKGDTKGDGFGGSGIPDWVWTSHFLTHEDAGLGWLEKVDWLTAEQRAVRGHDSDDLKLRPSKVVNVGLNESFSSDPEAQFFHRFAGRYGEAHSKGGDPPAGPPFQNNSMWDWHKLSRERAKKP